VTAVLAAVVFLLAVALGAVQAASDAIFSAAADSRSVAALMPLGTGIAIYDEIARVAPAPYANDMLARAELARRDLQAAQMYAERLPESANRSELLARIALARGDHRTAQTLFVGAGDSAAVDAEVARLAQDDPRTAYALETQLKDRLERSGTHPDAAAEAYWHLGVLAAHQGHRGLAMSNYSRALALSPISGKYLVAAGFQAYDLRMMAQAQRYFQLAISVDPESADAFAGAGMAALALGDRFAAQAYAARSRALDPHSAALNTLESQLR
jgi:tetratricopeptide (TPR) repeat protein